MSTLPPITVLMGGPGAERDISLASGRAVYQALLESGCEVQCLDIDSEKFTLPPSTQLCFNLIHGTYGEDGRLQCYLDSLGIPYTGAHAKSSALAFDKIASKQVFKEKGIQTPTFEILDAAHNAHEPQLPIPYVIKPPREGSSVGVHIIKTPSQLQEALKEAHSHSSQLLVEDFIQGRELTIGIVDDHPLPIIDIVPRDGFYNIENKYPWLSGKGGTDYYCPAQLSPDITQKVQDLALRAHRALGIEVYSRVDILLDADNEPYVLEINTLPGMTPSSLLPKAAREVGYTFSELCIKIAHLSLRLF